MSKSHAYEYSKEDLLGYSLQEIVCNQCGGVFCGMRVGRLYEGKPLIMCGRKETTQAILAEEATRKHLE